MNKVAWLKKVRNADAECEKITDGCAATPALHADHKCKNFTGLMASGTSIEFSATRLSELIHVYLRKVVISGFLIFIFLGRVQATKLF
jgi:hypothetical protein